MRALLVAALLATTLILQSCETASELRAGGARARRAVPPPAWLQPGTKLSYETRLLSDGTEDVLCAGYQARVGMEPQYVAILRNFVGRVEGQLDETRLCSIDAAAVTLSSIDSGDVLPQKLALSPGGQSWAWAGALLDEASGAVRAVGVYSGSAAAQPADSTAMPQTSAVGPSPIATDLWPLRVDGAGNVVCAPLQGRSVVDGLLQPWLRLDNKGVLVAAGTTQPVALTTGSLPAPDGTLSASLETVFDPALPANALVQISIYRKTKLATSWRSNYYIAPANVSWLPGMFWADAGSLAWLAYRPQASAQAGGGADGLFRLVCSDALHARHTLIEDHVRPDLRFIARGGVILYALPGGDGRGWDLWAAGVDGMSKQRLWHWDEAGYVNVEDMLGERRVLLSRMYVDNSGSEPRALCELAELSLDALSPGMVKLGIDPLVRVPAAEDTGAASGPVVGGGELQLPEAGEAGEEEAPSDPGGGFIPDEPTEPAEPQEPELPPDDGAPGQPPPIG
jgi:hypothetical protein